MSNIIRIQRANNNQKVSTVKAEERRDWGITEKELVSDYANVIIAPRATPPRASPTSNKVNEFRGRAALPLLPPVL